MVSSRSHDIALVRNQLVTDIQQLLSGLPANKFNNIPPNLMSRTPQQYKNLKNENKKNLNIKIVKKNRFNLIKWIGDHLSVQERYDFLGNPRVHNKLKSDVYTAFMETLSLESIARVQSTPTFEECAKNAIDSYLTGKVIGGIAVAGTMAVVYHRQNMLGLPHNPSGRLSRTSRHGTHALDRTSPYIYGSAALLGTFITFMVKYFSKLKLNNRRQREQAARETAALSACSASSST